MSIPAHVSRAILEPAHKADELLDGFLVSRTALFCTCEFGLAEDATSWTFPVATRHYEGVAAIEGDHANAHVTIAWKWQPNTAGASLLPDPKRHEAKADFSPSSTGWAMMGLTVDSDFN